MPRFFSVFEFRAKCPPFSSRLNRLLLLKLGPVIGSAEECGSECVFINNNASAEKEISI
jgi:hypothetical protein